MKKTRLLASLLCVMMMVCALPVLQASASTDDMAFAKSLLGVERIMKAYDVQVGADYDGTDVDTSATAAEDTYTADGVEFEAESGSATSWILQPSTDFYTDANAVVIKAKVGVGNRLTLYTEAEGRLNNRASGPTTISRTNILIADNRVYAKTTNGQAAGTVNDEVFMVGDEWFELMVVHGETTFEIYVKNNHSNEEYHSTNGEWQKLSYDGDPVYEHGHAGTNANHHFYASNKVGADLNKTYLSSFTVYKEDTRIYTIEEALSTYPASFNANVVTDSITMTASRNAWNFANSTMTTYTRSGNVAIVTPSGSSYTDEGLDLSGTNGTDSWKFSAFAGWNPVSLENTYGGFRAFYAKVKGDVTISYLMSDSQYMNKLRSVPGKKLSVSNASVDSESMMSGAQGYTLSREAFTNDPTVYADEWVEYLIIPRNTNASVVYAKSETGTGGAWVKAIGIDAYSYVPSNESKATSYNSNYGTSVVYDAAAYAERRQTGIQFSGSGVVAEWKTIDFNNDTYTLVASDEETKPVNANYLWFDEEFDAAPSYANKSLGDAIAVSDGVAHATTKYANAEMGIEATSGAINLYNTEIPVDGYAEFKMKSNGLKAIEIDDGVSKWNTTLNNDYSSFPGTVAKNGGYMADSDASWRTWRIVRGENGYSVYSKADGDTGWRIHATDGVSVDNNTGSPVASSGRVRFDIRFYGNADGVSDGNGQLDYIKIYGPAPTDALTLTDGYGSVAVESGETLSYPTSLRAIVTPETAKLIVASYKGNSMVNLKVVDSSELIQGSVVLNPYQKGVDKVEVFLWDGFEKQTSLSGKYSLGVIQ